MTNSRAKYTELHLRIEPDFKRWFEKAAIDRSVQTGRITSTSEVIREILYKHIQEVSNEQKEEAAKA